MTVERRFDIHTHHYRCGHAEGKIRDYIEAAIKQDFHVIGISDHTPHFYSDHDHLYKNITMKKSEFSAYVEEVLSLKQEYADKIDVLLGVESDYFAEHFDVYKNVLSHYPFDYIIGSVHFFDGDSAFNARRWEGLTLDEKIALKNRYYYLIEQSAKSGLFQVLGHIDVMKAFYPAFSKIDAPGLERALKVIGEQQVAIEVNTSGKTKDCGGWYPSDAILERALFYGVDITFGSDAHRPERVGEDFDAVQSKLKEIGFDTWCYVKNKQKVYVPIT